LEYKYAGHPDYDKRIYSGFINENETYLSECSADHQNCINRNYQRLQTEATLP
jgi:hypothetical protein